MKAIIVDDEILAIAIVKEYLANYPEIEVVDECLNGFEAFKSLQKNEVDLMFLDIQMPKVKGLELLELLDNPPKVIFTTAFDEYAIKAFEQNAVDYLLKPFSEERFRQAITKLSGIKNVPTQALVQATQERSKNKRIVVKSGQDIVVLPHADVEFLEAYDDYVKIHTAKQVYVKKQTLSHYEKCLPSDNFVRIHRSFLLNLSHLNGVEQLNKDSHRALLKNGDKLAISRSGYQNLKLTLGF